MKRLFLGALVLLAGCRPCTTPNICMPETFAQGDYIERCMGGEPEVDLALWWKQFDDPLLLDLIEQGLRCNHDLRVARERICEARAVYGIEFSHLLPWVDAEAFYRRVRNSQTLSDSLFTGGLFTNLYQAGFDSFWEIDLFGKNIDRTRAAKYEMGASAEEVRDIHVTISAEIAANYFSIRVLQERIAIAEAHVKSETELVALVTDRLQAGLISELDLFSAKALLAEREAIIPRLTIDLYKTIYSLAVLIGEVPENLTHTFATFRSLPCRGGKVPLGLPSELLCRRGDVRSAEFAMHAAGARVMAARKEFFPTLSLEGIYAWATGFFTQWTNPNSKTFAILPSLSLPLFHGGEILSNIQFETSLQKQRVLEYEQSVLRALEEVEGSLVAYFQEGARMAALEEVVSNNQEGSDLARTLYFAGRVDFVYVIEIERDLFIAQNALAESKSDYMTNLVAIYKALGGGWECCALP